MAYRSPIQEVPSNLARTIRQTLDFTGRSTRTETLTFLLVFPIVVSLALKIIFWIFAVDDYELMDRASDIVALVTFLPFPALLVRRLHDQDKSGAWSAILFFGLAIRTVTEGATPSFDVLSKYDFGIIGGLAMVAAIVALWGLSILPPTEGENQYGSDPRLDDAITS